MFAIFKNESMMTTSPINSISNDKALNPSALENLRLFRIIFKSANRHFHEIEKKIGIGGASLWALAEIESYQTLTVTQLAQSMSIHQSTASNLVEKLEKDGYIQRTRSEADKRVVFLSLSHAGKALLNQAPMPHRGMLPDALSQLNEHQLIALKSLLEEVVDLMQSPKSQDAFEPLGKL